MARLEKFGTPALVGPVVGAVTFVVGFLLTYGVSVLNGGTTTNGAGWTYYQAHFVNIETEAVGGSEWAGVFGGQQFNYLLQQVQGSVVDAGQLVTPSEMFTSTVIPPAVYLGIPIAVLLLAGFSLARVSDAETPLQAVLATSTIAVGTTVAAAAGTVLFAEGTELLVRPARLDGILLVGLFYPLVVCPVGGVIATMTPALETVSQPTSKQAQERDQSAGDTGATRPETHLNRRSVLAGAGTIALGTAVGSAGAANTESGSPEAVAREFVTALDAGDRTAVNRTIADDSELDEWAPREFNWVGAFEIAFVDFRTVNHAGRGVTGAVTMTIGGNRETLRYRFRENSAGDWKLWEAVDGLRSSPSAVAREFVTALDADDRTAVNQTIADDGELDEWTGDEFDWVGAFEIDFLDFQTVRADDRGVVGEIDMAVAGNEGSLKYRFRQNSAGDWKLWEAVDGLRD
ncbi:hypothetical protein SAMN05216226_10197 [Halovenus aranensis]|uniref:DUF7978 domain-containing protein n=1 Tax=Halovenus aranensis TaxID=890420 RepID=A0A1G8RSR7_9EURY|nr:hypothetical protein [Halovenus aranensis]SDJ19963.1 hypothetical protein SAMN05216226_10197 [Halovenus aranensis]